jgi:hypothetical protein
MGSRLEKSGRLIIYFEAGFSSDLLQTSRLIATQKNFI